MSEQRRMRAELKQGLHQFLMTLYTSYTETTGHEQALQQIQEVLSEEQAYFGKEKQAPSTTSTLQPIISKLEMLARRERDSSEQHLMYVDLETLMNAQEILSKYNLPEVHQ